jgi:hypothetical protein
MKIESIFRNIPIFKNLSMDKIILEGRYPIMFTCKNGKDVYLFICYLANAQSIEWIGTITTYENLINLLQNEITIRDAFLNITDSKFVIKYTSNNVNCKCVKSYDIPDSILPTAGEYMDAEPDEYEEEIAVFRMRTKNLELVIEPHINILYMVDYKNKNIMLPDSDYDIRFKMEDMAVYKVKKSNQRFAIV